jgi:hypothetical protein
MRSPSFLFCLCGLSSVLSQNNPRNPLFPIFDLCFVPLNSSHYLSFGGRQRDDPDSSFTDSYYASSSSSASTRILNASTIFSWTNTSTKYDFNLAGATAHALTDTNVIILFGKEISSSSSSGNIMLFDHVNDETTRFRASNSPKPRHHHLSFYNSTNNRLFVIGGVLDSSPETRFDTSLGQLGSLDSNLYYIDLTIIDTIFSSPAPLDQNGWGIAGKNTSSSRIEVAASKWITIEPPTSFSLAQAGLVASSGVIIGKYLLFCFGSSSNIPVNKCQIFDTVSLKYF